MDDIAQYSIIRFRPYPETGEFANIGILLLDRGGAGLRYKVVPRRFRRVSQFFNLPDPNVFAGALSLLQEELDRLVRLVGTAGAHRFVEQFLERGRESVWVFSNLRTVLRAEHPDDVLDELYERYVGRNFVNVDYREYYLVRGIRQSLRAQGIQSFTEKTIEDEIVPMKLPLVSELNGIRVIKPISLSQKTPLGIVDHAATWHDRFRLLISRGRLQSQNVLLPIEAPVSDEAYVHEAYDTAVEEFRALNVTVVSPSDALSISAFAHEAEQGPLYN